MDLENKQPFVGALPPVSADCAPGWHCFGKQTHGVHCYLLSSLKQARLLLEGWLPHSQLQAGGAHERKGLESAEHCEPSQCQPTTFLGRL